MTECEKCKEENRIAALEKDSERNSTQHREFYCKFSEVDVKQGIFDNKLNNIEYTLNEIRDDVKSLKEEPRQNYNAIKMCIITSIVQLLITGIFGAIVVFVK